MLAIGAIGFAAPWLLLGLAALPILWFLLRALPPAPVRRRFPGVALLLGLTDEKSQSDRTPWWLLLLRTLAVAAIILGFAEPILNPQERDGSSNPLLVLVDGTWADAPDWQRRADRVEAILAEAALAARPVAIVRLTDLGGGAPLFQTADAWTERLPSLSPDPWEPDPEQVSAWIEGFEGDFDTFWLSDGLARNSRAPLLSALESRGQVRIFESEMPAMILRPAVFAEGEVRLTAARVRAFGPATATVSAWGLDPAGIERELARAEIEFAPGQSEGEVAMSLPPELRNRIGRFEIAGVRSAGATSLTGDSLKRREVALISGRDENEGLELLSPLHYLERALEPAAALIDGDLAEVLRANPDVLVLADVAKVSKGEREPLLAWIEDGGFLLRFAGPRLAGSDVGRSAEDPLMPVRLRAGGRTIGGAMSWGEPKKLRPFADGSPFYGLEIPEDVRVSAQVVAQPGPELSGRTIAALEDGTPLVTRKRIGQGQVVLFHVTANAEWSTLPLSGLFVQMLERLAVSTRPSIPAAGDLAGTVWTPEDVLDAFGRLRDAGTLPGIPGERIAEGAPSAELPPGLYAGQDSRIAVNVIGSDTAVAASRWPARLAVEGLDAMRETALKGPILATALILLAADVLASLWLSGRLRAPASAATCLAAALIWAGSVEAQTSGDARALAATTEVTLAHAITGDAETDRVAAAGLRGLSEILRQRTSVEPADPIAVNLETDELAFYPFLYWPVTPGQPLPSEEAYAKLNRYLRTGGMILFDTRDADVAGFGAETPAGRKLRRLAQPLDIPPLEPIPEDHVLTRAFYLLGDFPGRHAGRDIWVEATATGAERADGMPFRNLNDNVTPVVIGGNDWAAAWAMNDRGGGMFPVGRGYAGERQREIAYRFGVNLVVHVLTGNYKSDQVHVPALLDRLGQ